MQSAPVFRVQLQKRFPRNHFRFVVISKRFFTSGTNRKQPPYNVLFFGSDNVSKKTLEPLFQNYVSDPQNKVIKHLEVVCPESLRDLRNSLHDFCTKNRITTHHPVSLKEWQVPTTKTNEKFDIMMVASFGNLIPSHLIESFPMKGLNMHPSMLPQYRGAAPIYYTLLNGDKETGVSIIDLSKDKFDFGRIFKQDVDPLWTFQPLSEQLATIGGNLLIDSLQNFWELNEKAVIQPSEGASNTKKVSKELGFIKWNEYSTEKIWNLWRALSDTFGVSSVFKYNNVRVILPKITPPQVQPSQEEAGYKPGMLRFDKKQDLLFAKTIDGWIGIKEIQLEGKTKQKGGDFANGYKFRALKTADVKYSLREEENTN